MGKLNLAYILTCVLSFAAGVVNANEQVAYSIDGTVTTRTRPFSVGTPWELRWELSCINKDYSCSAWIGVQDPSGDSVESIGTVEPGPTGHYYFPKGGTFLIEVSNVYNARWKIWAVRL